MITGAVGLIHISPIEGSIALVFGAQAIVQALQKFGA
jgi:hypothetical protein